MSRRAIWCAGMYGSASTWLFNVVRQIHLAAAVRPVSHFFSGAENFAGFDPPGAIDLVKSHEISDEATILQLAARARKIFVTQRDPRDAVASLMRSHKHDFGKALLFVEASARLCAGLAQDQRTMVLHYESGFFDDPAIVQDVAKHLDQPLSAADATRIFNANLRIEVEKHIARMPRMPQIMRDEISGDLLDPQTQWHTHHAGRTGETGSWRQHLSLAQAEEILARMPYLEMMI